MVENGSKDVSDLWWGRPGSRKSRLMPRRDRDANRGGVQKNGADTEVYRAGTQ